VLLGNAACPGMVSITPGQAELLLDPQVRVPAGVDWDWFELIDAEVF